MKPAQHRPVGVRNLVLSLAVVFPLAGCGDSLPPQVSTEERAIELLIDNWNNAKNDPKKATEYFAKSAGPPEAELKKYRQYTFSMTNRPSASGSSVTLPIEITTVQAKPQSTTKIDWTLEKEGDVWRIKSAPLP